MRRNLAVLGGVLVASIVISIPGYVLYRTTDERGRKHDLGMLISLEANVSRYGEKSFHYRVLLEDGEEVGFGGACCVSNPAVGKVTVVSLWSPTSNSWKPELLLKGHITSDR